jgi:hypothetical protein
MAYFVTAAHRLGIGKSKKARPPIKAAGQVYGRNAAFLKAEHPNAVYP